MLLFPTAISHRIASKTSTISSFIDQSAGITDPVIPVLVLIPILTTAPNTLLITMNIVIISTAFCTDITVIVTTTITMNIIDDIETVNRGLSMGAIGYYIPEGTFGGQGSIDLSVAIRTMVVRNQIATFNVGGGVVIDSNPASEYDETLTKAKSLLTAIGGHLV